jgi:hypothetical protein
MQGLACFRDLSQRYGAIVGAGADENDALNAVRYRDPRQHGRGGEEDAGAGAAYLVLDLCRGEVVVDEGRGGAGQDRGMVRDDPVDAVFGADRGPVARPQAEVNEARRGRPGKGARLRPGDAALALDISEAVREMLRGVVEDGGNG